jgi:two-component system OmpR family response regulator
MKILLVEDEPTLRAQLRLSLQEAGYAVNEAGNGQDAQFLGETEAFDAVVLDLGLPVIDGLTVLKRWRSNGRAMPVLILTARDNWAEKVAGIDAGADDYLTKPFHTGLTGADVRRPGAGHAHLTRDLRRAGGGAHQPRVQGA